MKLAALQSDFHAWLTQGSASAADRLGAGAGLVVYQNNYRSQLVSALRDALPLTLTWIGEEAFLGAAAGYIDRSPPSAWTLDAYAPGFAQALAEHFPGDPEVAELAWIETALAEAFVAADAEPLTLENLAGVDWEQAQLRLPPSFRMRAVRTNAEAIWTALSSGASPPQARMLDALTKLIVWRRGFTCFLKAIDGIDAAAFDQIRADPSFSALCENLVGTLGEGRGLQAASAFLATLVQSGLLTSIETPRAGACPEGGSPTPQR